MKEYTLPVATGTSLGGVKVGAGLTVQPDGTLNCEADTQTFQTALTEITHDVSEGKALVAAAITEKGVGTAKNASFMELAENVSAIETGAILHKAERYCEPLQRLDIGMIKSVWEAVE